MLFKFIVWKNEKKISNLNLLKKVKKMIKANTISFKLCNASLFNQKPPSYKALQAIDKTLMHLS